MMAVDPVQVEAALSAPPPRLSEHWPAQPSHFNAALRSYASANDIWRLRDLAAMLYGWAERFNSQFGLNVTTPAIAVAPVRPLGTYCPSPNGFGIDDEVVISSRHLRRTPAEILRTLLHEMVHQWQHRHGRPGKTRGSHHNLEFRAKCAELGIPCDARGCSVGVVAGSPFDVLLRAHGAAAQDSLLAAAAAGVAGAGSAPGSKLKKWRCGCTNVRCAVGLDARCLRCGERFECAEPTGAARPDANVAAPRTGLSAQKLSTAASPNMRSPTSMARRFQR